MHLICGWKSVALVCNADEREKKGDVQRYLVILTELLFLSLC